MTTKTILVTGIGGNVGQGILRNLAHLNYPFRLIGTNTEKVSSGNHLTDVVYEIPYSYEKDFIQSITGICNKEKVDLIIPGTDYETYYLALNRNELPELAACPAETAFIFLDKYLTYKHFAENSIPFAPSVLPVNYKENFPETIAKPRKGRGSRGIFINPPDISIFNSEEYIIQPFYKGKEITTAFYITKEYQLLGHITFERTLSAGTTNTCIVTDEFNDKIENIIRMMMNCMDIKGSCNIQSIVTTEGIIPFEINGRISGTNSVRSNFGFEDVKYIVEEYLLNIKPQKPQIKKGGAVRILMDVIYPDITSLDQIENKNTNHFLF
jgi:carbamoyl-phosphate synthase large subunit